MRTTIQHLTDIQAIKIVSETWQGQGFYSNLFVVLKSFGGWRAILDLKHLNSYLVYRRFKMSSLKSILGNIRQGDHLVSIDLKRGLHTHNSPPRTLQVPPVLLRWDALPILSSAIRSGLGPQDLHEGPCSSCS